MKAYANIIFMQGWEAQEPLALLSESHENALQYLMQWDNGEYHDTREISGAGTSDRRLTFGDYQIIYNDCIGYIGLEKILNT